jgi:hypothetical protein
MHTIEGLEPKYKLRTGPSSDRPRGNGGPRGGGFGGNRGNGGGFGGGNRNGGFGGNRSSAFTGNGNNGGASFHHSAPDSRHSHARPEGAGQGRSQGFAGQGQQPRSAERSFGNNGNRGGNSAPRRNGDRPSFAQGRGHNSGNKW